MVEDQVEDNANSRFAKLSDGVGEFGDTAGGKARIDRHGHHRVIAPAVGKAERRQVALIDPGDDRHQLDRGDVQFP